MIRGRYTFNIREKTCLFEAIGFVGLGISDSRNEGLHDKLKSKLPKQEYFGTVVRKVL